jgi:elongator complex protein 1
VASLSSTSEPTAGVEHALSWQPSGSIIAATQKLIDSNKPDEAPNQHVIFFERNGLRRYDFALREDTSVDKIDGVRKSSTVKSLAWNSDSTILALWIERKAAGVVTDVGEWSTL